MVGGLWKTKRKDTNEKVIVKSGLTPQEANCKRKRSKRCGKPISTHTHGKMNGVDAIKRVSGTHGITDDLTKAIHARIASTQGKTLAMIAF